MTSSTDTKNPGGRPRTGQGKPIMVRLQPADLAALDEWIKRQPKPVSRPEAIRAILRGESDEARDLGLMLKGRISAMRDFMEVVNHHHHETLEWVAFVRALDPFLAEAEAEMALLEPHIRDAVFRRPR